MKLIQWYLILSNIGRIIIYKATEILANSASGARIFCNANFCTPYTYDLNLLKTDLSMLFAHANRRKECYCDLVFGALTLTMHCLSAKQSDLIL